MIPLASILFLGTAVVVLVLAVIAFIIVWKVVGKLLGKLFFFALNSIGGLVILLALNLIFDARIPLNIFTVAIVGIFGLAGIASLLLLKIGGML